MIKNGRKIPAAKMFPVMGYFLEQTTEQDGSKANHTVCIHKKGPITMGWEVEYPVAYTMEEEGYDAIIEQFYMSMRHLPEWCVVHKQDMFLYDEYAPKKTSEVLDHTYELHFQGRKFLRHRSYIFITMATQGQILKKGTSSGLFGITSKVPVPKPEKLQEFLSKCSEFIMTLTSSPHIRARELTKDDWQGTSKKPGIIQQYMMLGNDSLTMSDVGMSAEGVYVYDKSARCCVVCESDQCPNWISNVKRVERLSGQSNDIFLSTGSELGVLFPGEHVVNQMFVLVPNKFIETQLDKKRRKMTSGMSSTDNRLNAEEISGFLDEMYASSEIACYTSMNIIAWAPEGQENAMMGRLSAALSRMNITKKFARFNMPVLWYAGIPSCAFELGMENMMIAELGSALCMGCYETFETGLAKGVVKACERIQDTPVIFDTQEEAQAHGWIDNYNIFCLGGSGTGKSFWTNTYVWNLYNAGECIYIIDVGDSYEGLCGVINSESGGKDGHYYRWDREHPFSFNIFINWRDWLDNVGNLRQEEPGVNYFQTVMQMIWSPEDGWTTDSLPILRQTLRDFISHAQSNLITMEGELILDDYFRYVSDVVRPKLEAGTYVAGGTPVGTSDFAVGKFIRALSTYAAGGDFGFLFNDRHPADLLNSNFVVFEVDALSEVDKDGPFYSICIFSIMHAFDVRMRSDAASLRSDRPFKQIVIEEAWKAIANDFIAPTLKEIWKTARKFRTSAMVVTQEIGDIISSEIIQEAILQNSSIKFLMDQSNNENNFGELQTLLGLTEHDKNLILSMNKRGKKRIREVFVKLGNKYSACFSNEVSSHMALAFESNKGKKADLLRNYKESGDMVKALLKTVKDRSKGKK